MSRTPSTPLRAAVGAVKLGVAAACAFLAVGPVVSAAQDVAVDQAPTTSDLSAQAELDALMTEHDCSATGLGPDVIPGSALVERDDAIQRVSFDDGWAVFTGDAEGALLAVCRSGL